MKSKRKLILPVLILLLLAAVNFLGGDKIDPASIGIIGGADGPTQIVLSSKNDRPVEDVSVPDEPEIDEDGVYDSKEDVALYIDTFGHLPSNYITKSESEALEKIDKTKNIGGDYFGNFEGKLPKEKGREYHECDIDTPDTAKYNRGVKRIVFSNDRLVFYTPDHYETFYQYKDGAWEKI